MTTSEVLKIVSSRGLRVRFNEPDELFLTAPKGTDKKNVTKALMAVLKLHREAIIELMRKKHARRATMANAGNGNDGRKGQEKASGN